VATIRKLIEIDATADHVWSALADFQNVHIRLAPGFLTGGKPDGDTARIVSFANGAMAKETLVACDHGLKRLVYFIAPGERIAHHNASAEIVATGEKTCRFIWTTDVLPDGLAPYIDAQMTEGAKVMKATMEG
jgi:hypothetical protein